MKPQYSKPASSVHLLWMLKLIVIFSASNLSPARFVFSSICWLIMRYVFMADTDLFRGNRHLNSQVIYILCCFPSAIELAFFFHRSFLTLSMPSCSSLLPRSEIHIDHKPSPSAVTHICEPKEVENSHGYLEILFSRLCQDIDGERNVWHWWKTGGDDMNLVLIVCNIAQAMPGAWGCYSFCPETGSCLPPQERGYGCSLTSALEKESYFLFYLKSKRVR